MHPVLVFDCVSMQLGVTRSGLHTMQHIVQSIVCVCAEGGASGADACPHLSEEARPELC